MRDIGKIPKKKVWDICFLKMDYYSKENINKIKKLKGFF